LPKWRFVKRAKSREISGRIKNVTIRRNPSLKYFVSILVETEVCELPKTNTAVGIYVGLKDIAKAISELSWSQFRTMLKYKAKWYGKTVIAVAKNSPSSQLRSSWGNCHKDVKALALHEWGYLAFNSCYDRDYNASINHGKEAIRLLTAGTVGLA